MEKATIFNIQRFCIHDGPGIRTTVFFKGCSLRCLWCSNPESQKSRPEIMYSSKICIKCGRCAASCPKKAIQINSGGLVIDRDKCDCCNACENACYSGAIWVSGREYTVDEVFEEIWADKIYYEVSKGGVTLSGGEPLLQIGFVKAILKKLKANGIHSAIETAGNVDWENFERIYRLTDLFLFDLKHMTGAGHISGTGTDNKRILSNLEKLVKKNAEIRIRLALIPNFNTDEKNIMNMVRYVEKLGIKEMHLLPYHKYGKNKYKQLGKTYKYLDFSTDDTLLDIKTRINENFDIKVKIID